MAAAKERWKETKKFEGEGALRSKNTVRNKTNTFLYQFLILLGKFYMKILVLQSGFLRGFFWGKWKLRIECEMKVKKTWWCFKKK